MFSNRHPNKYRSVVQHPKGYSPIKPTLAILWGFTIGLSFYFMDDIYLFSIGLEQQASQREQQIGQRLSSVIAKNPQVLRVSEYKHRWTAPIEEFYEREMRFGTKRLSKTKALNQPTPKEHVVDKQRELVERSPQVAVERENDTTMDIPTLPIKQKEILPQTTVPRKVLLLGGSSMKTAMGSLLQSKFREIGVEAIREAQIGTGLARADVVDWLSKADTILSVHEDIDLLIVQFIGNDCQTLVDSNHTIEARFGSTNWTATYLNRWDRLLEIAQKHDAQLVIVGLPVMKSRRFDNNIQSVSRTVFDWADDNDVPVVQIRDLTTNPEGNYQQYKKEGDVMVKMRLKDGVHLSYQGSKRISQHIFLRLQEHFHWTTNP